MFTLGCGITSVKAAPFLLSGVQAAGLYQAGHSSGPTAHSTQLLLLLVLIAEGTAPKIF